MASTMAATPEVPVRVVRIDDAERELRRPAEDPGLRAEDGVRQGEDAVLPQEPHWVTAGRPVRHHQRNMGEQRSLEQFSVAAGKLSQRHGSRLSTAVELPAGRPDTLPAR
jgi:hypothetical protein